MKTTKALIIALGLHILFISGWIGGFYFAECQLCSLFSTAPFRVQWEVLLTGYAAIIGGYFALQSAMYSTKRAELRAAQRYCWRCALSFPEMLEYLESSADQISRAPERVSELSIGAANFIEEQMPEPSEHVPHELLQVHDALVRLIYAFKKIQSMENLAESDRKKKAVKSLQLIAETVKNLQMKTNRWQKICEKNIA